ncbi:MAG: NAD(P)-dependent oxidoreductase [Desulfomonile tiedjei]|nr:NAD(P)-dependent oxidoreductase [Desulfomonile tiedjei]
MRVAITGAGGQIGSYLTENLSILQPGIEVVGVCRNAVAGALLEGTGFTVRVGTLTDPVGAESVLNDCDAVVHCALATGLPVRAHSQNEQMIRSICRVSGIKKLIFLSSVAVYGMCIDRERASFEDPKPDTSYGREKLAQERSLLKFNAGTPRTNYILRLGHVYGPNQAMSRRILHMAQDSRFALPLEGRLLSNAIHLERLGEAIARLLTGNAGSGVYNVADEPHQTWKAVFDWHTEATEIMPVRCLSSARSEDLMPGYRNRAHRSFAARALAKGASWAGAQLLSVSPSWKELGYQALGLMPERVEQKVKVRYRAMVVKRDIESVKAGEFVVPDQWLTSDPMPGLYMDLPKTSYWEASRQADRKQKLNRWFQKWSSPYGPWAS